MYIRNNIYMLFLLYEVVRKTEVRNQFMKINKYINIGFYIIELVILSCT